MSVLDHLVIAIGMFGMSWILYYRLSQKIERTWIPEPVKIERARRGPFAKLGEKRKPKVHDDEAAWAREHERT